MISRVYYKRERSEPVVSRTFLPKSYSLKAILTYTVCTAYTVYMPQKTFYLRNEDLALWRALSDKSQFIHDALNNFREKSKAPIKPPIIKQEYPSIHQQAKGLCKHGWPKGLCKKGCK